MILILFYDIILDIEDLVVVSQVSIAGGCVLPMAWSG
jgi:hypothetical protein